MIAGFRSLGGTSKTCPHPAKTEDGSGWNLALPRIRRERTKLARLANFKPAKMPVKMEVGQLCQLGQHFFEECGDHWISIFRWDFEDLSSPCENRRRLGMEPRPPEDKAGADEVGQVGQLQTCKKAYKNGTWPTWPTFFDGCVDRFVSVLVGLEDSTAPYEDRRRLGMEPRPPEDKAGADEVGQVGQLQTCKKGL